MEINLEQRVGISDKVLAECLASSGRRYPSRDRKTFKNFDNDDEMTQIIDKPTALLNHKSYDFDDLINSAEFAHDDIVKKIPIEEFDSNYIKQTGLSVPLIFHVDPADLGMRMPHNPSEFSVCDIIENVGNRKIEVVEVKEQKGRSMQLSEFVQYYMNKEERKNLLNVLSLEFTSTNLEKIVSPPKFVPDIDWIDKVWPKELHQRQKFLDLIKPDAPSKGKGTDTFSTYPKVQRYCLMSVENCFTDFHIDFGGTSVWYHILKGRKIFWIIEPSHKNIDLYEEWILGGSLSSKFFGRVVDKCSRVELVAGDTLIIPSGYIHSVYTPEDSLVFGGNFLHSYAIPMQIRVSRSEDRIKVPPKYRFPHFKQMFWCYLAQVIYSATGRRYQAPIKIDAFSQQIKNEVHELNDSKESIYRSPTHVAVTVTQSKDQQELVVENAEQMDIENVSITDLKDESQKNETDDDLGAIFENQIDENGDEICYEEMSNYPNGSYDQNPVQLVFSRANEMAICRPVAEYNKVYINSLSQYEINGFFVLLHYMKKLYTARCPEVTEGITRPRLLLEEFENFAKYLAEEGYLNMSCTIDLVPKNQNFACSHHVSRIELTDDETLNDENDVQGNVQGSVRSLQATSMRTSLTIKLPSTRRQSIETKDSKLNKSKRKISGDEDLREDGQRPVSASSSVQSQQPRKRGRPRIWKREAENDPLPTQTETTPNPYGFDPLSNAVALGKAPIESAWRKSHNMIKLPAPQQRYTLKREIKSEDREAIETNEGATTQIGIEEKLPKPAKKEPTSLAQRRIPKVSIPIKKLQEHHSDLPELAHHSPLASLQKQQQQSTSEIGPYFTRPSEPSETPNSNILPIRNYNVNVVPTSTEFSHKSGNFTPTSCGEFQRNNHSPKSRGRGRGGRGRGGYNQERGGFGSGNAFEDKSGGGGFGSGGGDNRSFDGGGDYSKESGFEKAGFGQRKDNEGTSGFNKSGGFGASESQNEQSDADSMSKSYGFGGTGFEETKEGGSGFGSGFKHETDTNVGHGNNRRGDYSGENRERFQKYTFGDKNRDFRRDNHQNQGGFGSGGGFGSNRQNDNDSFHGGQRGGFGRYTSDQGRHGGNRSQYSNNNNWRGGGDRSRGRFNGNRGERNNNQPREYRRNDGFGGNRGNFGGHSHSRDFDNRNRSEYDHGKGRWPNSSSFGSNQQGAPHRRNRWSEGNNNQSTDVPPTMLLEPGALKLGNNADAGAATTNEYWNQQHQQWMQQGWQQWMQQGWQYGYPMGCIPFPPPPYPPPPNQPQQQYPQQPQQQEQSDQSISTNLPYEPSVQKVQTSLVTTTATTSGSNTIPLITAQIKPHHYQPPILSSSFQQVQTPVSTVQQTVTSCVDNLFELSQIMDTDATNVGYMEGYGNETEFAACSSQLEKSAANEDGRTRDSPSISNATQAADELGNISKEYVW